MAQIPVSYNNILIMSNNNVYRRILLTNVWYDVHAPMYTLVCTPPVYAHGVRFPVHPSRCTLPGVHLSVHTSRCTPPVYTFRYTSRCTLQCDKMLESLGMLISNILVYNNISLACVKISNTSLSDMRTDMQEIFKMTPHDKQVIMFPETLSKDDSSRQTSFVMDKLNKISLKLNINNKLSTKPMHHKACTPQGTYTTEHVHYKVSSPVHHKVCTPQGPYTTRHVHHKAHTPQGMYTTRPVHHKACTLQVPYTTKPIHHNARTP
ncbi:hypothetical protein YC2023_077516 [Brassica napus]